MSERRACVSVHVGALFYGRTRRRAEIVFDAALRRRTEAVAAEVRALFERGMTPPPPAVAPLQVLLAIRCLPAGDISIPTPQRRALDRHPAGRD
jgi:CRISPR-associated exonuclease Cas4